MRKTLPWFAAGVLAAGLIVGQLGVMTPNLLAAAGKAGGKAAADQPPGEVVQVGAGSYVTRGGGRGQPVRGPNFTGPAPTQQWFSNLVFKGGGSNPMFAFPLAFQPSGGGLQIANPGNNIGGGAGGINASFPKGGELTLTSDAGNFSTVALDDYSDWFIQVAFLSDGKGMHVSYGHGSPFVYALFDSGGAVINANGAKVWAEEGSVLGITVGRSHYGLFGPTGSTWSMADGKMTNQVPAGKSYFALAALPDATPATLAFFKKYAYSHVTDTKVAWKLDGDTGTMKVTYNFTTKPYEGQETGTITALLPHQWRYFKDKPADLATPEYPSARGVLKIVAGPSFTTWTPIQGILPLLPPPAAADKSSVASFVKDAPGIGGGGTYGVGKSLGKVANLSGVAEAVGDSAVQQACISNLKRSLEGWLSAGSGKSSNVFTYNPSWGILVGLPGGYGSDWPFNDHHFHYGYFIRAAAEVARIDPAWAAKDKWGGMVDILIRECASPDRNDKLFPFARCFDRYEGHGWASGDAGFAAGNNEESSSESMNCWYGIAMWGAATGDTAMRDWGLYLFTQEMTAIEEYWWDVTDENFPKAYNHECVGMVWGTGGGYGTWFSGDADCIFGINYLPYTPGSMYLVRYPDYIKRASAAALSARKAGANFSGGWGDLHLMFMAGADPAKAADYLAKNPNMGVEGGNSKAFLHHWISTLNSYGVNDKSVTADYPLYNVYNKGGKKTYAVYNMSDKPLTVKFTDGMKVEAKTKGFTVVTQ
jgi:endoglucanase Acf2